MVAEPGIALRRVKECGAPTCSRAGGPRENSSTETNHARGTESRANVAAPDPEGAEHDLPRRRYGPDGPNSVTLVVMQARAIAYGSRHRANRMAIPMKRTVRTTSPSSRPGIVDRKGRPGTAVTGSPAALTASWLANVEGAR